MSAWLLYSQTSSRVVCACDVHPPHFLNTLCHFWLFFQHVIYLASAILFNTPSSYVAREAFLPVPLYFLLSLDYFLPLHEE